MNFKQWLKESSYYSGLGYELQGPEADPRILALNRLHRAGYGNVIGQGIHGGMQGVSDVMNDIAAKTGASGRFPGPTSWSLDPTERRQNEDNIRVYLPEIYGKYLEMDEITEKQIKQLANSYAVKEVMRANHTTKQEAEQMYLWPKSQYIPRGLGRDPMGNIKYVVDVRLMRNTLYKGNEQKQTQTQQNVPPMI